MNLETIHTKVPFHCIRRQWGTHKLVVATQVSWSMQEVVPFHCIRRQWGTHKLVDATQVSWSMQEVR